MKRPHQLNFMLHIFFLSLTPVGHDPFKNPLH